MNHQVVMTPWNYCYIDLYQGDPSVETPTYGIHRHFSQFPKGADVIKEITYRNGKPIGKEITVDKKELIERAKQQPD